MAETDGNLVRLGILGVCFSLTYAVSCAVFGHLSDRLGHRRLIAAGAVVFSFAYGLARYSMEVPLIYLEGILGGISTALVFPALIALLSLSDGPEVKRGHHQTRTLILFCLFWNMGVVSGNVTGGWLFARGPQASVALGLVLAALHLTINLGSGAWAWWHHATAGGHGVLQRGDAGGLGESSPGGLPLDDPVRSLASEHAANEPEVTPARQRFFALVGWLANISGCVSMSLLLYVLPRLMTELGISAPVHGTVVMSSRLAIVCTYLVLHFTGFWRYRLGPALAAQSVSMLGLLILSLAESVAMLTAGVMLVGVMMGYTYFSSIFYSTTGFSEKRRGLASGLHEGTLAAGFTAGSLGGGYLGSAYGIRAPFQVGIAVLALSVIVQISAYARFRRRNPV